MLGCSFSTKMESVCSTCSRVTFAPSSVLLEILSLRLWKSREIKQKKKQFINTFNYALTENYSLEDPETFQNH